MQETNTNELIAQNNYVEEKEEIFLGLDIDTLGILISFLGICATVSVSLIALYLPQYIERRKGKKFLKIIDEEYKQNDKILKKAKKIYDSNKITDSSFFELTDEYVHTLINLLIRLNLTNWNNFKYEVSIIFPQEYLEYQKKCELINECIILVENAKKSLEKNISTQEKVKLDLSLLKSMIDSLEF